MVTKETEDAFRKAINYMDNGGGDSEAYARQAMWKGLYKSFAIQSIGIQSISKDVDF